MRKIFMIVLIAFMANILLSACSSANTDAPAQAVEAYLNTVVAKDADRLPTLVCGDWEDAAMLELDSFQAVTPRLEDVSCSQTGTDGDTALVKCTGKIIVTYDDEDQELDLSIRTFEVIQQGSDWLVCGAE